MSLLEVAKLAGVSTATVCRVLRHSAQVRPETAEQVTRAMAAVGYVPPASRRVGRGRTSKSSNVGRGVAIVTVGQTTRQWLHVPVIASFVASVTEVARQRELDVLLDELPSLGQASRLMRNREIGGAILLVDNALAASPAMPGWIGDLAQRVPLVWALGSHAGSLVVDRVTMDSHCMGQMAAMYLVEQGCERLAFVTNSPRSTATRACAAGFVSAAYDRGLETSVYVLTEDRRDGQVFSGQVVTVRTLDECVRKMSSAGDLRQGLFTPADGLMVQLYPRLGKAGLEPGREICLVCCEDETMRLSGLNPRPTTFEVNTSEIAARAVRRLQSRIARPQESPVLIQVPPILARSPEMVPAGRKPVATPTG